MSQWWGWKSKLHMNITDWEQFGVLRYLADVNLMCVKVIQWFCQIVASITLWNKFMGLRFSPQVSKS